RWKREPGAAPVQQQMTARQYSLIEEGIKLQAAENPNAHAIFEALYTEAGIPDFIGKAELLGPKHGADFAKAVGVTAAVASSALLFTGGVAVGGGLAGAARIGGVVLVVNGGASAVSRASDGQTAGEVGVGSAADMFFI